MPLFCHSNGLCYEEIYCCYCDAVVDAAGGMFMAGLIAGVGFVACDHILAVTLLTVSWAFSGLINVGPHISAVDMSPQHAGRQNFLYPSHFSLFLSLQLSIIPSLSY